MTTRGPFMLMASASIALHACAEPARPRASGSTPEEAHASSASRADQPLPPEKPATPPLGVPPSSPATSAKPDQPTASPPPSAGRADPGISGANLSDLYAFIACASADNPNERWGDQNAVKKGVPATMADQALGAYRMGWNRFYVDCPFGKDTSPDGKPAFTFFGAQRVAEDSTWRKGFVSSWKRLTTKPGVHVIAYMGNPCGDPEFVKLAGDRASDAANAPDPAGAVAMLRAAVQPIIDAGFQGLAIDACNGLPERHLFAQFLLQLESEGLAIYIEPTPLASQRWLTRFGTIRTTWFARGAPGWKDVLDPAECRGEKIVLFDGTVPAPADDGKPFRDWARRWVHDSLARGERPATGPAALERPKLLLDLK